MNRETCGEPAVQLSSLHEVDGQCYHFMIITRVTIIFHIITLIVEDVYFKHMFRVFNVWTYYDYLWNKGLLLLLLLLCLFACT